MYGLSDLRQMLTRICRNSTTQHLLSAQSLSSWSGSTHSEKVTPQESTSHVNLFWLLLDDFTQLNERFIKSCRDYENLLDASMTQTQPAYQYGRHQQGYGGGYPPQAAPPQQDTQRYYTPNQQQGLNNVSEL